MAKTITIIILITFVLGFSIITLGKQNTKSTKKTASCIEKAKVCTKGGICGIQEIKTC